MKYIVCFIQWCIAVSTVTSVGLLTQYDDKIYRQTALLTAQQTPPAEFKICEDNKSKFL